MGVEGCNDDCLKSVLSRLPSRIVSTSNELLQSYLKQDRLTSLLDKTNTQSSTKFNNKRWTLEVELKLLRRKISKLSVFNKYLLKLQDWFNHSSEGSNGKSDLSSIGDILYTVMKN